MPSKRNDRRNEANMKPDWQGRSEKGALTCRVLWWWCRDRRFFEWFGLSWNLRAWTTQVISCYGILLYQIQFCFQTMLLAALFYNRPYFLQIFFYARSILMSHFNEIQTSIFGKKNRKWTFFQKTRRIVFFANGYRRPWIDSFWDFVILNILFWGQKSGSTSASVSLASELLRCLFWFVDITYDWISITMIKYRALKMQSEWMAECFTPIYALRACGFETALLWFRRVANASLRSPFPLWNWPDFGC